MGMYTPKKRPLCSALKKSEICMYNGGGYRAERRFYRGAQIR